MVDAASYRERRGRRLAVGALALAIVAFAALILNAVRLYSEQENSERWETHTYRVIVAAKDLLADLEGAETGQRGYLLSGDAAYLQPFGSGASRAPVALERLSGLTRDNPSQVARIADLRLAVAAHLKGLARGVASEQVGDRDRAIVLVRSGEGKRSMDGLRRRVGAVLAEEDRLLAGRSARARDEARASRWSVYALAASGLLLLILATVAIRRAMMDAARARLGAAERQARDFLLAVVDGASDPIFAKDRQGRFLLANAETARVLGADRDAMIGKRDADLLKPETARVVEETDRRIMESGRAEVIEEEIQTGGEVRIYQASKAPWVRDGEVLGLIGVSRDITDRKAAEAALKSLNDELETRVDARTREIEKAETQIRQMQKMESIGQLTGGIAHDFNNMLAIVIGSLDIARRRMNDDPKKALTFIDNARDGATRAASLTSRLLAFSRQQPLAPELLDANKLVANMSELLRRTIGEGVKIETVLAGGLWRTMADPGEVENALVNLCVNARDAMLDGGRLTIETANTHLDDAYAASQGDVAVGQYVMICVSDTGSGMPPEVIDRAFDPFYTTKAIGKGTGLGLSQVYGFIKQSGGHVRIYSEIGHGTTVKIYLPRWFGPEVVRTPAPYRDGAFLRGDPGEIVLVVEDEAGVRNISVDALRELGYTVIHADGAAEALRMIEEHPKIDMLFTDIIMPEMNGRQLADRAVARKPDLKVLYTTGYTRNAVVHNGVLDPGVAFLPKPFTIDQLAVKVRQVLDARVALGRLDATI